MEQMADGSAKRAKKLVRSRRDKWISGVSGGLGEFFEVDSNLVRLAFAASCLFGGAGVAVYAACWVIIPLEGEERSIGEQMLQRINQSQDDNQES